MILKASVSNPISSVDFGLMLTSKSPSPIFNAAFFNLTIGFVIVWEINRAIEKRKMQIIKDKNIISFVRQELDERDSV